jgi:peptide/nickel transport system permease protein
MLTFFLHRAGEGLVTVVVVSMLVFAGVYAIGDPLTLLLPPDASAETEAELRRTLGLDRPLWAQYGVFLGNLVQGEFGQSFAYRQDAMEVILARLPATLELAFAAIVIAVALGVPLGLLAGTRPDGPLDRAIVTGSILGFSMPTFMVGLALILVFSVWLGWLPSTGRGDVATVLVVSSSLFTLDGLRHVLLPATNLALFPMAFVIRLTRSGMIEAMDLDFVRFARAQGHPDGWIIRNHVLKYIAIPIVTVVGMQFGLLIAFAVVTESIFAWPGVGRLIIEAIQKLDRPLVVAYIMVVVTLFVAINILVDLIYSLLDPRVRPQ